MWINLWLYFIFLLGSVFWSIPALPPFILRRREFLDKIRQKFVHFLRGHSSAPGSKFAKMKRISWGFFLSWTLKKICATFWQGQPPQKPRVLVPPPQNFLKQSRILGGAHVGVRLVVFGNKVAPKGAPKGKNFWGPMTPQGGDLGGQTFFFPTPSLKIP